MPHGPLLQEVVLVYAVALALLIVAGRVGVPPIVALILSGIVSGPAGLRIVGAQADVELLAEIGIALLLFTAGLDFSVSGLRRTWRHIVFGGSAQMASRPRSSSASSPRSGVVPYAGSWSWASASRSPARRS